MEQAAVSQLDHRQALGIWSAATVATSLNHGFRRVSQANCAPFKSETASHISARQTHGASSRFPT